MIDYQSAANLIFAAKLANLQKLVLLALAYEIIVHGNTRPSHVMLAERTGQNKHTVTRRMKALAEMGVVTRSRDHSDPLQTWTYQINWDQLPQ